jgi:hypothetical protein
VNDIGDGPRKSKGFNGSRNESAPNPNGTGGRFAMIPRWAAGEKILTKTAQRVDVALGSLCDVPWGEERIVRASLSELAKLTKIDRRHVARAVRDLERAGRLQKWRRPTEYGGFGPTEYLLLDREGVVAEIRH